MNKRNVFNYPLDHIGHAVNDLTASIKFYTETLGWKLELTESLDAHQVDVAFVSNDFNAIELLAPKPNNTVLKKFLSDRGEGLHHLCYRVESVKEELEILKAKGFLLIDEKPRLGSRDLFVAFIHPKSTKGVLLEICSIKE
ncbi:MAG: methylmalonyl-CoA epimerase [Proteobacteria bacterium]|nr:methylmalonyl-CoA epimerase [Pseudomonadota bacterium]